MRLEAVRLRNFRSFTDETISFGGSTVIVGANDAGKSTIVDALRFVFAADAEVLDWTYADVRGASGESPAIVSARFADLTNDELEFWAPFLWSDGTLTFIAAELPDDDTSALKRVYSGGDLNVQVEPDVYERVTQIDASTFAMPLDEFFTFMKRDMRATRRQPAIVVIPGPERGTPSPTDVLLPLLMSSLDLEATRMFPDSAGESGDALWGVVDRAYDAAMDLNDRLERAAATYGVSGARVAPHFGAPGPLAQAIAEHAFRIHVVSSDRRAGAPPAGAGSQRAAVLASLDLYSDPDIWPASRPVLLVVEEPEAGLHPGLQRRIARSLRVLPTHGVQTIITTHSPIFINAAEPGGVRIVRAASDGLPRVTAGNSANVRDVLGSKPSDVLLGERFLVVEGAIDKAVMETWAATIGIDLTRAGAHIVVGEGADRVSHIAALLEVVYPGAAVAALFDGDSKGSSAAQRCSNRFGDRVTCSVLHRGSIEEYYALPAMRHWAATVVSQDQLKAIDFEGQAPSVILRDVGRLLGRKVKTPENARRIASMMLESQIAPEIVAILMGLSEGG